VVSEWADSLPRGDYECGETELPKASVKAKPELEPSWPQEELVNPKMKEPEKEIGGTANKVKGRNLRIGLTIVSRDEEFDRFSLS